MSGIPDHLQTQHHNHKAKSISVPGIPNLLFVPARGSDATIGIYWRILNGQFIMARIIKTNK
ncbi:hypothetical protein B7R74_00970 [Yersinia pseudotuberculosis]|nr:hypothetical protein B7R74_00970 [Yersinia pseudotuberculosis]